MKNPKPEPVVVTTICSLCGEPWQAHGDNPDTLDCIRLLKAKAAQHPVVIYRDRWHSFPVYPTYGWQQVTSGAISVPANGLTINHVGAVSNTAGMVEYRTPAIEASCSAVTA